MRPALVVGFAAETNDLLANARAKLDNKGCDLVVANDVGEPVFGQNENKVHIVSRRDEESWPRTREGRGRRKTARAARATACGASARGCSMNVAILRLPHAEGLDIPFYASEGAAGLDLCAAISPGAKLVLEPGARELVPTGFALALPAGFEAQVRPRSGLALEYGVTVLNAPGTIDSDYRGEVQALLVNLGARPFEIIRGMRIAQLVVAPFARVRLMESAAALDATLRGANGFGSTGQAGGGLG